MLGKGLAGLVIELGRPGVEVERRDGSCVPDERAGGEAGRAERGGRLGRWLLRASSAGSSPVAAASPPFELRADLRVLPLRVDDTAALPGDGGDARPGRAPSGGLGRRRRSGGGSRGRCSWRPRDGRVELLLVDVVGQLGAALLGQVRVGSQAAGADAGGADADAALDLARDPVRLRRRDPGLLGVDLGRVDVLGVVGLGAELGLVGSELVPTAGGGGRRKCTAAFRCCACFQGADVGDVFVGDPLLELAPGAPDIVVVVVSVVLEGDEMRKKQ